MIQGSPDDSLRPTRPDQCRAGDTIKRWLSADRDNIECRLSIPDTDGGVSRYRDVASYTSRAVTALVAFVVGEASLDAFSRRSILTVSSPQLKRSVSSTGGFYSTSRTPCRRPAQIVSIYHLSGFHALVRQIAQRVSHRVVEAPQYQILGEVDS